MKAITITILAGTVLAGTLLPAQPADASRYPKNRSAYGDWDRDGVRNSRDRDNDNDGIPDYRDRYDYSTIRTRRYTDYRSPHTYRRDVDRDGRRNKWDRDVDGDGVRNKRDADKDGDGRRNKRDDRPKNPRAR